MEETVQLRVYTVHDLREWLLHNRPHEGISSKVIAPTRAHAFINNPYVQDDMPAACAIFVNDDVAAYTAVFPEVLHRPKGKLVWWFSTLWCNPQFEGRGYGLIVVGTLVEALGEDNCFDAEGASETVKIFSHLGFLTDYQRRHIFTGKSIRRDSFKGIIASVLEKTYHLASLPKINQIKKTIKTTDFRIEYQGFVDDEAYLFIQDHSPNNSILRTKESLNWIIRYPFLQDAPLNHRCSKENSFSSLVDTYQMYFIKVYRSNQLIGISLFVHRNCTMSIKYLYYEAEWSDIVFNSLMEHCFKFSISKLDTSDESFAAYIVSSHFFTKHLIEKVSFSYPKSFCPVYQTQGGDGDMFI